MSLEAYIEVKVRDRFGKVIVRRKKRSRSFVRAFNHALCAQIRQETTPNPAITTKDTAGANQNLRNAGGPFYADAPAANATYGAVIGTDNTPVDIENFQMGAKCGEGTGANQVNHQACTVAYLGVAAGVSSFKVERSFLNNSGDTINVEEIGVYTMATRVGAVTIYIMVLRDLYSLAIPDGGGMSVTYTIRIAV